jgi:hypothetical protein
VGEPCTATVTCKHIDAKRSIVIFDTVCTDKDQKTLMTGEVKVMLESPQGVTL